MSGGFSTRTLQVVTHEGTLTEKQIRDHFQKYGNIVSVRIHNSSFIEFETQEQASNAILNIRKKLSDSISIDYAGDETQPMNPDCASSGYARDLVYISPPKARLSVTVFWDWNSFEITCVHTFKKTIENELKVLGFSLNQIHGYGNPSELPLSYRQCLIRDGVILHDITPALPGEKLRDLPGIVMIHAIKLWCADHDPPSPVLVISGDPEVAEVMDLMRKRRYTVFLIYNVMTAGIKASADLAKSIKL